jgi:hypothetical protein
MKLEKFYSRKPGLEAGKSLEKQRGDKRQQYREYTGSTSCQLINIQCKTIYMSESPAHWPRQ